MVQGLGIRLPEQRTQVQSLFQEDPKSHGETAHEPQLLKPTGREPRACSEGGHRDGKTHLTVVLRLESASGLPGKLITTQAAGPILEFLIQQVWGRP